MMIRSLFGPETGTGTGTGPGTGTGTGSVTGSVTGSGTGTGPGSGSGSGTGAGTGAGLGEAIKEALAHDNTSTHSSVGRCCHERSKRTAFCGEPDSQSRGCTATRASNGSQWKFTGERVVSKQLRNHGRELKVWELKGD